MKEAMEKRLADIQAAKEQKLAEVNVLVGHIGELEFQLAELAKIEAKTDQSRPEEAT